MTELIPIEKIEGLGSKLQCPICQECMCVPQSLQKCKHTYCYECLKNWFIKSIKINNLRCPMCRLIIEDEPFNNKILQSVMIAYNEITNTPKYFERLKQEKLVYETDLKNNSLFERTFKDTGVGVIDMDDGGVIRCSSCHWEIEPSEEDQNECPHCGVVFRSMGNRRMSDDEGESINTEREQSDGPNESGSDLEGFIISELSEDEIDVNSESSMNSDYYEYNVDEEVDDSLDNRRKKRRRSASNEFIDLSNDNDDIVLKNKSSRNKKNLVVIDEDDE